MASTTTSDTPHSPETPHLNVHPHAQSDGTGWIHQIFDAISKNRGTAVGVILATALVGGAGAYLSMRSQAKAEDAANALFLARKTVSQELKAIAESMKKGTPAVAAKGATPGASPKAPTEASEESVRFERFDVDAKMPKSVQELQALASGPYAKTRAAYEAKLVLGNLYFDHGDPSRAAQAFAGALETAPTVQEKGMAHSALGRAQENAGKYAEAIESYGKALSILKDSSAVQGELMLAQARCHELQKDPAKARAIYDQILSQMPSSEYAKTAESLKARLQ